jgi:DNA helicase HerA-like ATPase
MSLSPLAYADSLRIGTIDFVSPDEIKVLLEIEAPDGVALNTGTPRPFPRINGYVLIPSDEGHLVAQVEWITIERSQYPKRRGMQDFGLVDLPYPLRKMSLNPLGCLFYDGTKQSGEEKYRFRRGVESYPTVGDSVLLPSQNQLHAIVKSGDNRHVVIGTSPLAANAEVAIDPDRLFGRHLAVLGNTGSGKSCSVAGLIRWSLEAAERKRGGKPNARFIVLDPNGEYANAFEGLGDVRVYAVEPSEGIEQLQVPLWFWNSEEWSAFTQASGKTQRPILRRALREVRTADGSLARTTEEEKIKLRRKMSALFVQVQAAIRNGIEKTEETKFGFRLKAYLDDINAIKADFGEYAEEFVAVTAALESAINSTIKEYPPGNHYFRAFTENHIAAIRDAIEVLVNELGGVVYQEGPDENCPLPFNSTSFADQIDLVAQQENATQFVDFLVMRIRTMLSDSGIQSVMGDKNQITLDAWLRDYIGDSGASNGSVSIIDLSLVPAEVVHIITAVIARMTLEAQQRYRNLNRGEILPTVMVMEEAHTFIKRYNDGAENQNSATICCQIFEKIAREGRKFGLGLVLSSQRPSELSPTVLSQCNSFLMHRISNDRDQDLVHKLVPDNLRGLLRDLPSLPSRHAILLGWASELPVLVQMNQLPEHHRPKSDDPDFWAVWSGQDRDGETVEREVDWKAIADDWQQINSSSKDQDLENDDD